MKRTFLFLIVIGTFFISCEKVETSIKNANIYNIIEPGNGIYVVIEKNVSKEQLIDNNYEELVFLGKLLVEIKRYNRSQNLTDEFSVSAISRFEYDIDNRVKFLRYFNNSGQPSQDELFGYSSIEYIYDDQNRVRMEIYRDKNNKFLEIPFDDSGNISNENFISPVLTYEYIDNKIKIKAFDKNFNLLKEIIGDKPCIPFIDCGESD